MPESVGRARPGINAKRGKYAMTHEEGNPGDMWESVLIRLATRPEPYSESESPFTPKVG